MAEKKLVNDICILFIKVEDTYLVKCICRRISANEC